MGGNGALLFEIWYTKVDKNIKLSQLISYNLIFQLRYELYALQRTQHTKISPWYISIFYNQFLMEGGITGTTPFFPLFVLQL